MKIFHYWIFIFIAVLVTGCMSHSPLVTNSHREPSTDLSSKINAYLDSDEQDSDRLLAGLSEYPVVELEPAIRFALSNAFSITVPTGEMPSQSLQVEGDSMSYSLYVPPSYNPVQTYPVVLCLHGAGFGGDAYLARWIPRLDDKYILICPTISGGAFWTREGESLVLESLSRVAHSYHIDNNRVFLTGMSNGGISALLIGLNHPDRFAALIPMAAGLDDELFPLLDNAKDLPIYIIHGTQDQVMPIELSRRITAYLENRGYSVLFKEHNRIHPLAGGHYFPKEELPALVDWMNDKKRRPVMKELNIVHDRDHVGRVYWVRIDETSTEAGSFWASESEPGGIARLKNGAYVRLQIKDDHNTIFVNSERVLRYTLFLNSDLVDFKYPISVINNGTTYFSGMVRPDSSTLLREIRLRRDPSQFVEAEITVDLTHSM